MEMLNCFVVIWLTVLASGILLLMQIRRKRLTWDFKLVFLALVFLLILLARMAVNLCAIHDPTEEALLEMNGGERLLDSVVHTFQSFSMDEDYTAYTVKGRELVGEAYGTAAATAYGTVISILNVLAPLLGGAVLLEILTGIFPRLKVLLHPFRRKFVFSELNEAAVTLAEDLYREDQYKKVLCLDDTARNQRIPRPLLIFAGTDGTGDAEESSDLISRANILGAVFLKTDLSHIPLRHSQSVYYFLISEQEQQNISTAADLLRGEEMGRTMWPTGRERIGRRDGERGEYQTKVFAFCQSDMGVTMINRICASSPVNDQIMVRPLRDYANMAVNLMYQMPLFVPLLSKEEKHITDEKDPDGTDDQKEAVPEAALQETVRRIPFGKFQTEQDECQRLGGLIPTRELHVTILGSGAIAEEAFLAAFWCGQIGGVQLHLHVLSKEAGKLEARLRMKCPELLETCEIQGENMRRLPSLKIYPHTDSPLENPPYAVIDGFDENIDVTHMDEYPKNILNKTDYFIVALGEDERNIYVATLLKRELGRLSLKEGTANRHPMIAPAVYDQELADAVADNAPGAYEPYLIPFGTLKDRFSCRNVFMSDMTAEALESEKMYNSKNHANRQKDEYSYWANITRAIHAPYKLYALRCITGVDLSGKAGVKFNGKGIPILTGKSGKSRIQTDETERAAAWMEHRRWNAYMRSQGFVQPTDEQHERYFRETGSHKDLKRKLHNCLVESGLGGERMPNDVRYPSTKTKNEETKTIREYLEKQLMMHDALDMESILAYHMNCEHNSKDETGEGRQQEEYKQWDGFLYDSEAQTLMKMLK